MQVRAHVPVMTTIIIRAFACTITWNYVRVRCAMEWGEEPGWGAGVRRAWFLAVEHKLSYKFLVMDSCLTVLHLLTNTMEIILCNCSVWQLRICRVIRKSIISWSLEKWEKDWVCEHKLNILLRELLLPDKLKGPKIDKLLSNDVKLGRGSGTDDLGRNIGWFSPNQSTTTISSSTFVSTLSVV